MKLKILMLFCLLSLVFVSPVYAQENVGSIMGLKVGPISYNSLVLSNNKKISFNKPFDRTTFSFEDTYTSRNFLSSNANNLVFMNSLYDMKDTNIDCCSAIVENNPIAIITKVEEPKIEMGNFEYKMGEFQGPWGDLTEYANQLTGNRGYRTRQLLAHVGKAPVNEGSSNYAYEVDRWKEINGKGVVRYSQGGSTPEDWNYLSSGDSTFAASACGAYSTACVLSTMLGKYINVPEVAIAINTYELRNPGSDLVLCNSDGDGAGAFRHTDLASVIREAGLKTEVSDVFDKEKVDKCLNDGGMVIYVVGSDYGGRYTYGAHYIVIREKTDTGYLVYSSTNWSNSYYDDYCNTENTAEELSNLAASHGAQMVLVNY